MFADNISILYHHQVVIIFFYTSTHRNPLSLAIFFTFEFYSWSVIQRLSF